MAEVSRKPLLLRIGLRARRDGLRLVRAAYLHLYALPLLRLKGELPARFSLTRGQGVYLLTSDERFLKVAVTPVAAPGREYANGVRLREAFPELADLLPAYRHVRAFGLSALACEVLVPLSPQEALAPAVAVHQRFLGKGRAGRLVLADCPHIVAGLGVVEAGFGPDAAQMMRRRAEAFLSSPSYRVGPAHGDFHSRNVMRDKAGNTRLIDLDCVRLSGIIAFDALYFALEQDWSATGRLWTMVLAEALAHHGAPVASTLAAFGADWNPDFAIAFFLDRIGQDSVNYGISYERPVLAAVIDAARAAA